MSRSLKVTWMFQSLILVCSCRCFQPFQAHLAATTDPDKKQMLERLDAAVTAALQPLQAAMDSKAAAEVVQPLAQVRLSRHAVHLL